jgi:hypothetical protein
MNFDPVWHPCEKSKRCKAHNGHKGECFGMSPIEELQEMKAKLLADLLAFSMPVIMIPRDQLPPNFEFAAHAAPNTDEPQGPAQTPHGGSLG